MKVGELAKRTGISVRTLHYYEEIGLVPKPHRNRAGYRLYGVREVERLQQVRSLQCLGFSLEEIRGMLASPAFSAQQLIETQLNRVRNQIALQTRLCDRLETLAESMRSGEISLDQLVQTIEVMSMFEKYYTPEQLEELKQRRESLGEDGMKKAQQDWADLIKEVQAEMIKGTDPKAEKVRALGQRWQALVQAFTGGNPQIAASLSKMYQSEPVQQKFEGAPSPELMKYIGQAMGA